MINPGRILLVVALSLAPAACGFLRPSQHAVDPVAVRHGGEWYCLANDTWDGWNCGRDPQLAQYPLPPRPAPELARTGTGAPDTAAAIPAPQDVAVKPDPAVAEAATPVPTPASPASATPVAAAPPEVTEPDWRHLAYHPATVLPLEELPTDFYAVQMVALSTMAALEDFRTAHRLSGVLGAQVEAGGKVYYALLLGVYESMADARAAAASRPESLRDMQPWIRKVSTLQAAVARAEVLASRGGV